MNPLIPSIVSSFIAACSAWFLAIIWSRVYDNFKTRLERHEDYLAWLRGLEIECNHVLDCIREVRDGHGGYVSIQNGQTFGCPVKKLNCDFFQQSRFEVIKHPRSVVLQKPLTTAFRDVDHTNGMMAIYEQSYGRLVTRLDQVQPGQPMFDARASINGILGPTIASLNGVESSVGTLLSTVREQYMLESQNPPKLEAMRTLSLVTVKPSTREGEVDFGGALVRS